MGVVEVAALRPCPVYLHPRPFHLAFVCALSPIRCYFTITLYDAQFRTNSLTFAPPSILSERSRARTRAAFTCGGDEFRSNFNNTAIEWR